VGQEDGTSQLLLQGLARVQCTDLEMEGAFWTARIAPIPDLGHTEASNPELMDEVRMLALAAASQSGPVPEEFATHLDRLRDPGVLADTVSNALVSDPQRRQQLLEEENVTERLKKVRKLLKADLAL
jgi:ATP-dependent Lon protease